MLNKIPKSYANCTEIYEKTEGITKIAMFKYENVFDYFSQEPSSISVKLKQNSTEATYSKILQITIWKVKDESISFSIYASDRENPKDVVIRKVVWNMNKDMDKIKKTKTEKDGDLNIWADIKCYHQYISAMHNKQVIEKLTGLDVIIKDSFTLLPNETPTWEYRDIQLLRLLDWGQINFVWSPTKKNDAVEAQIKKLIQCFDLEIGKDYDKVFSMGLNYEMLPQLFKKLYLA